jgi:hypothetical protein
LIKVLGVQPNPKTQAIYHSVRHSCSGGLSTNGHKGGNIEQASTPRRP